MPTAAPRSKVGSHSTPPRYHTPQDVLGRTLTEFALARLNFDGSLDAAFDADGKQTIGFNSGEAGASDVAVQSDGKIVAAGWSGVSDSEEVFGPAAALRLNSDGSLDSSFGTGGKVWDIPVDSGNEIAVGLQSNGKVIVGGRVFRFHDGEGDDDFAAVRLNADGSTDGSFGAAGRAAVDFTSAGELFSRDTLKAVAVQSDGNILLAGWSHLGGIALARLIGDPVQAALSVSVDIRPESLNVDSNGLITVLIYGAADFDASQIDVGSVQFAGAVATQWVLVDANQDGRLDLQLKFRRQDTVLDEIYAQLLADDLDGDGILDSTRQTAEVSVTGQTLDDVLFSGSDSINLFLAGRSLRNLLDELFG